MDLNYLYQRRGIAVFMSANAACPDSRGAHRLFAEAYARRIADARGPFLAIEA
jgi:hypothetical protein